MGPGQCHALFWQIIKKDGGLIDIFINKKLKIFNFSSITNDTLILKLNSSFLKNESFVKIFK